MPMISKDKIIQKGKDYKKTDQNPRRIFLRVYFQIIFNGVEHQAKSLSLNRRAPRIFPDPALHIPERAGGEFSSGQITTTTTAAQSITPVATWPHLGPHPPHLLLPSLSFCPLHPSTEKPSLSANHEEMMNKLAERFRER